jgi:CheY-like chemotaxis protein
MIQVVAQASESGPQRDGQRRLALVVEDDRFFAEILEEMLRDIGYDDVRQAPTERDALLILDRESPDVAVVDTNLFGIPAHRVADRLRAQHVPFIVVTGFDPTRLPAAFTANPTLRKPIKQDDLAAALDRARH